MNLFNLSLEKFQGFPKMTAVEILLTVYVACFGLVLGSFLGLVAVRLPAGESLVQPRSRCRDCGRQLTWYENVPILSYVCLRGKCRRCGAKISAHYAILELLTVSLTVFAFWKLSPWPRFLVYLLLFIAPLLLLMIVDWMYLILPDVITLPGILAGFLVHGLEGKLWLRHGIVPSWWKLLSESLLGALAGALTLLLLAFVYKKLRHEEGMGMGDVKLGAMLGAFFGWKDIFFIFFLASVLGVLVGILLKIVRGQKQLPFGSFLAAVAILYLFYGPTLLRYYLKLI